MSTEDNAKERVRQQRMAFKEAGWHETKVWTPSKSGAEEIRALAEKQRVALIKNKLEELMVENKMTSEMINKLRQAMYLCNSKEYVTTHGAFSDFLTDRIDEGNFADVVTSTKVYAACYPGSIRYVLKTLPAKVMNYLCREFNTMDCIRWSENNPDWGNILRESVQQGSFVQVMEDIEHSIKKGS